MKRLIKATIYTVLALGICVGIVYAASGTNFDWLSVSPNGILIGDEGSEGENLPMADVIEFSNTDSGIMFSQGGQVVGEGGLLLGASSSGAPSSILTLNSGGQDPSGLISLLGDVGMGAGHAEGEEGEVYFVPDAAVMCRKDGDVIVQLGAAEGGGEGEGEGEGQGESRGSSGGEDAVQTYRFPLPELLRRPD